MPEMRVLGKTSPSAWSTAQAPGLAGNLRHIADTVLRDPDVDVELPLELGRLHLLLHAITRADEHDDATRAELQSLIGGRSPSNDDAGETVEDHWFIAGRRVEERDRLITSASLDAGHQIAALGAGAALRSGSANYCRTLASRLHRARLA